MTHCSVVSKLATEAPVIFFQIKSESFTRQSHNPHLPDPLILLSSLLKPINQLIQKKGGDFL